MCVEVQGAGLYCGTGLGLGRACQRSLNGASCLNNREEGARLVQVTEIWEWSGNRAERQKWLVGVGAGASQSVGGRIS